MTPGGSGPGPELRAFRWLLVLTGVLFGALAAAALFGPGIVHAMFGPRRVAADAPGLAAVTRLFGAAVLPLAVGTLLVAARPERNRTMLLTILVALAAFTVTVIVVLAKNEVSRGISWVYAVVGAALLLLLFRYYPRVREPDVQPPEDEPRM